MERAWVVIRKDRFDSKGGGSLITRRQLVIALGSSVFAGRLSALAQTQGKVWRIGFLGVQTAAGYARQLEAFRGGLKDFGYVEGKNLVVEYRWAEGHIERLPQLAAELLREKLEILVTHGSHSWSRPAPRPAK